MRFAKYLPLVPVVVCAGFVCYELAGALSSLALVGVLAALTAAIMVGICRGGQALLMPVLRRYAATGPGADNVRLASYAAIVAIYLAALFGPIFVLSIAKLMVPPDCSITLAWLGGLALTVVLMKRLNARAAV